MIGEDGKDVNLKWFVARTRRSQELSLRASLQKLGYEHFIPVKEEFRVRRGRRARVEVPVIPNMVFVKASKEDACALANGRGLPLYYIVDRFTHAMMEVPEKQMDDFIRVVNSAPDSICIEDVPLVPGTRVRVVEGELAGVEGEVLSLPTGTYVAVSVGRVLCAKLRLPKACLEPVI